MGTRPLEDGEPPVLERYKRNFMYPKVFDSSASEVASSGAGILNPQPIMSVASSGKSFVILSSDESLGSSDEAPLISRSSRRAGVGVQSEPSHVASMDLDVPSGGVLETPIAGSAPSSVKGSDRSAVNPLSSPRSHKRVKLSDSVRAAEAAALGTFYLVFFLAIFLFFGCLPTVSIFLVSAKLSKRVEEPVPMPDLGGGTFGFMADLEATVADAPSDRPASEETPVKPVLPHQMVQPGLESSSKEAPLDSSVFGQEAPLDTSFFRQETPFVLSTVQPETHQGSDIPFSPRPSRRDSGKRLVTEPEGSNVHRPNWRVYESSLLDTPEICCEFLSSAFPPAERLHQRSRPREEVWDHHAVSVVSAISTLTDMWRDIKNFMSLKEGLVAERSRLEEERRVLVEDQRSFAERYGDQRVKTLEWDLSSVKGELERVTDRFHKASQDWKVACEATNARHAKLAEAERAALERASKAESSLESREKELADLRAQMEATAGERSLLAENLNTVTSHNAELIADRHRLISSCIPRVVDMVKNSDEFQAVLGGMLADSKLVGRQEGFDEGLQYASERRPTTQHPLYDVDVQASLDAKTEQFDVLTFPILDQVVSCAGQDNLDALKALVAEDVEGPVRRQFVRCVWRMCLMFPTLTL